VVFAKNELICNMHPQHLHLCGNAAAKLIELLSAQGVQVNNPGFQMHRAFHCALWLYGFASQWAKSGDAELVRLEAELMRLEIRDRIFPRERRQLSTCCHISGDGMLTTHSGSRARLSAVCVSSKSPSIAVHPRAQKEEIGARLVLPSSLSELINATGVPK